MIACITDGLLILVLPATPDASNFAIAQAGAFTVAMLALLAYAGTLQPAVPRLGDLARESLGGRWAAG
jgi:hypothetical protein